MVSGFDEDSCSGQIRNLHEYLAEKARVADDGFMDNLAFTLNERRSKFMWKAAVTGSSPSSVADALSSQVKPRMAVKKPSIGFVFTGQGAQWCGMGKELWSTYPVFRQSIERIDGFLSRIGAPFTVEGMDLTQLIPLLLIGNPEEILRSQDSARLSHPLLSQPICSALQIALVDLLASWGIFPDSVTGHSSGEIAAAYAVGSLCMEDAISAAYHRGAATGKLPAIASVSGAMLAVGIPAQDIQPYMESLRSGKVVVACKNSPSSLTISGDLPAIEELEQLLHEKQMFARRLAVDVAYHSHHMELIGDEYLAAISHVRTRGQEDSTYRQTVSFFSSVTGAEVDASQLGPQYWVRNLLGQVKFVESLQALCFGTNNQRHGPGISNGKRTKRAGAARKVSIDYLIEIGPHSALAGPIKQIIKADSKLRAAEIMYGSVLTRKADAVATALALASSLAASGCSFAFDAVNRPTGTSHKEPQLLVDLPPYAWNHTKSYWAEPRLSKIFRSRKHPRTDLLGVSDTMSCPFEPRWRNFIRVSEIPWLGDHKIQSNIVYPAAGYIVMAIEASSQHLLQQSVEITGYVLHDVSILSALVVSDTSAVEVMISLKPDEPNQLNDDRWFEFHIYSITGENRWTEHCKGMVGVQFADSSSEIATTDLANGIPQSFSRALNVLDVDKFYEKLANLGLEYGRSFANMTKARFADGACIAEIVVPDTAASMPTNFQHPFVIHPCTLDSTFHSIFVPVLANMGQTEEPPVPVFIDQLYVSRSINSAPGAKMEVRASINAEEGSDIVASLSVMDRTGDSESPAVAITGLRCRRLADDSANGEAKPVARIAYNLKWDADPDLLSAESLSKLLGDGTISISSTAKKPDFHDECASYYVKRALASLTTTEVRTLKPHLKRLWSLFTEVEHRDSSTAATPGEPAKEIDQESLRKTGLKGELLCAFGRKLPSILNGTTNMSAVVNDNALSAYWDNAFHLVQGYRAAARYLDIVGHKNPKLSILEVGAGTGGASLIYLQRLTGDGNIPRCDEYTFTHPDASGFEKAASKLDQWRNLVHFKTLDIDGNPEKEGFGLHGYDVVIVSHGLYMSTDRHQALKNIYKLVRPDGHLILIDPFCTRESLAGSVIFGHFPVWWPSDPEAALSDGVSKSEWDHALRETKFSGADSLVECKSGESEDACSLIISRPLKKPRPAPVDALVIAEEDSGVSTSHLQDQLARLSVNVEFSKMDHANPTGRICVVLSDLKTSVLAHPNKGTLKILKQVFLQSAGVVWVTRGGRIKPTNPDAGLAMGFARTARSESGVNPIVTLDLDGQKPATDKRAAEIISDIIRYRFLESNTGDNDVEYVEKDGVLLIPRVVENVELNQAIASLHDHQMLSEQVFHQKGRPLRAVANRTKDEGVYFDDLSITDLADEQVGVEVRAFGLISHDLKKALKLGSGCSGVVHSVGKAVHRLAPGDHVVCLGSGSVTNIYQDRESAFQKIPAGISFELAAALPAAYCMALYALDHLARVNAKDAVLIIGAAEAGGQALLELCHWKDVQTFAIVATESQRSLLSSRFRMPEGRVFVDSDPYFTTDITSTNGIDAVINCRRPGDKAARLAWKCIAPFGRFIQVSGERVIETPRYRRDVMLSSFDLLGLCRHDPAVVDKTWSEVIKLFSDGKLEGPSPLISYGISNMNEVTGLTEPHATGDSVIITAGPDDLVKVSNRQHSTHVLIVIGDPAQTIQHITPARCIVHASRRAWRHWPCDSALDGRKWSQEPDLCEPKWAVKCCIAGYGTSIEGERSECIGPCLQRLRPISGPKYVI